MSSRNQQGALLAGLFLIGIGLLFLISNWLPDWSFWVIISRYWPIILIVLGVQSLYRYFTYTPSPPPPSPPPPPVPSPPDRPSAGWAGTNPPPDR